MRYPHVLLLTAGVMLTFSLAAEPDDSTLKVLDSTGRPVAGAVVDFYTGVGSAAWRKPERVKREITDRNGIVKVGVAGSWDQNQIVVHKPGFSVETPYFSFSAREPALVTLGPAFSVSGRVVDEAGNPVPNAQVGASAVYRISTHGTVAYFDTYKIIPEMEVLSARTGTDGRFQIDGLPYGKVDLYVSADGKALVVPPRDVFSSDTMIYRAGQQDVVLKLQPAGAIQGKVLVPNDQYDRSQIIIAARNLALPGSMPIVTRARADGSFRVGNLGEGTYDIEAHFGTNDFCEWVAPLQQVSVQPGTVTQDVKITPVEGGVLEVATLSAVSQHPLGKVTYYAMREAPSLSFEEWEHARKQASRETSKDGVGRMRLLPGTYIVNGSVSVQIEAGKTNRVELKVTPSTRINGTVRDTNGAPSVGVEVTMNIGPGLRWSVTTDTNGHYQFKPTPIPNGSTRPLLIARDRDRNLAAALELAQATETCDLQLAPALVVSGRVQDEHSQPLTNAVIYLYLAELEFEGEFPKIDAQGGFEIRALPTERSYTLNVTAEGHSVADLRVNAAADYRFESAPITLRVPDKKVAGVVVDANDKPIPAQVSIIGEGQVVRYIVTDDKGRFESEVCAGTVDVDVSARGYRNSGFRLERAQTNIVVTLKLERQPRKPLLGKALPNLTSTGISADALQTNKPILICLFDPEQRSSLRTVRLLGERVDALKEKGVSLVAISATQMTADALKQWKQSNPTPFPLGAVTEKTDKTQWILSTEKLPWLILSDPQGRIKAEGFDLDELDPKLK